MPSCVDQQGQPPHHPVVVGPVVDEAAEVGSRGDGRRVEQHAGGSVKPQQIGPPVKRQARARRSLAPVDVVEIEIVRCHHAGPGDLLSQVAVVVQQAARNAAEGDVEAEVALEGLLDADQGRAVGFGEEDVERDGRRLLCRDALDQGRNSVARPWPLADSGQADIVDVDDDGLGRVLMRGAGAQEVVHQELVELRNRRQLEDTEQRDKQRDADADKKDGE